MAGIYGQLIKAQFENLASDISSPPDGVAYFNTSTKFIKYYDSSSWRTLLTTDATQVITSKDFDGGTASDTSRITIPKAATATLNALTRKQGGIVYDTSTNQFKGDDGSNLTAFAANTLFNSPYDRQNYQFTVTPSANAYVIALKDNAGNDPSSDSPVKVAFRSSTQNLDAYVVRSVTSALSITIPSGTAIGQASGATGPIHLYFLDNAGTVELALAGSTFRDQDRQTTTAISGGNSRFVLYSTTARTNVAVRWAARILQAQTVAGTWAAAASNISSDNFGITNAISMIRLDTGNGYGSISTRIRRFTNSVQTGASDALAYVDSATLGGQVSVTESGVYCMYYSDFTGTTASCGISLNGTVATDVDSLSAAERIVLFGLDGVNGSGEGSGSVTMYLTSGDVVRAHVKNTGKPTTTTNLTQFTITQICRL